MDYFISINYEARIILGEIRRIRNLITNHLSRRTNMLEPKYDTIVYELNLNKANEFY